MATLANLVVRISGNTAQLGKAITKAEGRLAKFKTKATKGLKAVGTAAKGLAAGGALAIAGFAAGAVTNFLNVGEELDKMAKRTGFSVEALGELKFAAEQSGSSIESIEKATKKMAAVITDADQGLLGATDSLAALGLTAEDLKNLSPEEQFQTLANALGGVTNASEKAALAQKVFGKAGTELLPLFAEGEAGMAALRAQAQSLGIVMSTEAAAGAATFNDSVNELKSAALGVFREFASKLLPKLAEFARFLVSKKPEIVAFFTDLKEKVTPFINAFQTGVATIFPILQTLFQFVFTNKPILIAALLAIGVAVVTALGPVSLAALAIVGIITLIGFLKENWTTIWGAIKGVFETVWGAIQTAFSTVAGALLSIYQSKFGWLLPAGPLIKAILFVKANWDTIWGGSPGHLGHGHRRYQNRLRQHPGPDLRQRWLAGRCNRSSPGSLGHDLGGGPAYLGDDHRCYPGRLRHGPSPDLWRGRVVRRGYNRCTISLGHDLGGGPTYLGDGHGCHQDRL